MTTTMDIIKYFRNFNAITLSILNNIGIIKKSIKNLNCIKSKVIPHKKIKDEKKKQIK
jgi:hypothetical protein